MEFKFDYDPEVEVPKRKRAKRKAIVSIVLIISLIGYILGYAINTIKLADEQIKNDVLSVAQDKIDKLDGILSEQKALISSLAKDPAIIEAATEGYYGEFDESKQLALSERFSELNQESGNLYENIYLVIGGEIDEGYADMYQNATLHSCNTELFYIECYQNGEYFALPISPVTGRHICEIAYAVYGPDNSFLGAINGTVDLENICQELVAEDDYKVSIYERDGFDIANTDEESAISYTHLVSSEWYKTMFDAKSGIVKMDLSDEGMDDCLVAYSVSDDFYCIVTKPYNGLIDILKLIKER